MLLLIICDLFVYTLKSCYYISMFIIKVARAFTKYKIPYAVIGGHAVNLHGAIRGTIDIDFIINWTLTNLTNTEKALNEIGLISRLPITAKNLYHSKEEYIRQKNLVAWNFYNPNNLSEQVDIIITHSLKKNKTVNKRIKGFDLKVLNIDDLIEMKKMSNRDQDIIDIEALEKLR